MSSSPAGGKERAEVHSMDGSGSESEEEGDFLSALREMHGKDISALKEIISEETC
jgi:hypothetical protein